MKRSPVLVFVLATITFGIYLIFWYIKVYAEFKEMSGKTPTGNSYLIDFLLSIVTCGVWGIYVDYSISKQLDELLEQSGLPKQNSAPMVVILDVASYFTAFLTYIASSAIHQDILNQIHDKRSAGGLRPA